jgi:CheY-like chemotaxis protein
LLAFSRKQILRPQLVHLGRLVENLRKMLARLIGEDIRLVTVIDPNLSVVRADPGQLEQILLNLVVNARDAMPRGGTLTIECRNVSEAISRSIRLSVSDTGVGMNEEVKARIFEPFFTTKAPGKGTGLGLATVFGIVQQSGGRIQVQSRPGVGTTFQIDLPATGSIAEAPASQVTRPLPSRGSETVLLVEDEGAVRMLALHALQTNGYAVLDAETGEQALHVVQTFGVPVRLLVTDVVMPGLNGRELAERLQNSQPSLRVLYMSGYTSDEIVRRGIEADRVNFLQKPFTPQTLIRKVREILDSPG